VETLFDRKLITDSKKEKMVAEAKEIAQQAADFADSSPWCSPEELFQDVYAA
jgi:TPP-dependent pyruvate/acetoin dehydrogenase alpha subunit